MIQVSVLRILLFVTVLTGVVTEGLPAASPIVDVGYGSSALPKTVPCNPVSLYVNMELPRFVPGAEPVIQLAPIPPGTLGPAKDCSGVEMRAYAFIIVNATATKATCDACAQAYAQTWASGYEGQHVNDFGYAVISGNGWFGQEKFCPGLGPCVWTFWFEGDGAKIILMNQSPCVDRSICSLLREL